MRINEIECDDNIVLSKFKCNCDEIDKSIPAPLPKNLNHFIMIVGKPGSSKTTLLLNLICKRGKLYTKSSTGSTCSPQVLEYYTNMPADPKQRFNDIGLAMDLSTYPYPGSTIVSRLGGLYPDLLMTATVL